MYLFVDMTLNHPYLEHNCGQLLSPSTTRRYKNKRRKKETNVKHFTCLEDKYVKKFICTSYLFLDMTFNLPSLEHNFGQHFNFLPLQIVQPFCQQSSEQRSSSSSFLTDQFLGFHEKFKEQMYMVFHLTGLAPKGTKDANFVLQTSRQNFFSKN